MNRTPPQARLASAEAGISPDALDVIGTLARTYDAQRLRLLDLRGQAAAAIPNSALRPLGELETAVILDGKPVSASIVDAVVQGSKLAGGAITLPLVPDELAAAEAGWWDALLGDVERRTGLAPRAISIALGPHTAADVRAVLADRVAD